MSSQESFPMTPWSIGSLRLKNRILYAPLAGCSDYPFRRMSAKYQPALMFCEMVKMDALVRQDPSTFHLLDYDHTMHPIAAQLCGSSPEYAYTCVQMLEDLGFCLIDLNCGCPVDKVTKDGSGSGLLRTLDRIGEIIAKMVAATQLPITIKIRAGWDDNSIIVKPLTRIAQQAGARAIFVHGRTRQQGYKGPSNWDHILAAKQVATIPVIGNGDLFSYEHVAQMHQATGCDAFLISRGTMGKPWFVQEVAKGQDVDPQTVWEGLKAHYEEMKHYHNDMKVLLDMRRVGCYYIKDQKDFRKHIAKATTLEQVEELLEKVRPD